MIPQIQLKAVHTYGWITAEQLSQAFAIAQAAPGPGTLLVSAIGYQAGGIPGALLATANLVFCVVNLNPLWVMGACGLAGWALAL